MKAPKKEYRTWDEANGARVVLENNFGGNYRIARHPVRGGIGRGEIVGYRYTLHKMRAPKAGAR